MSINNNRAVPLVARGRGVACGVAVLLLAQAGLAQPDFSEWSTPIPTVGGGCPIESRDGNYLFTASRSAGTLDIWTYRRNGRRDNFGDRTLLGPPVSLGDADDFCPTPLTNNWLMFVSTRNVQGACGQADMYISKYGPEQARTAGFADNLGCAPNGPNTMATEFSPSLVTTAEGTHLYYSSNIGGDQDIYRSEMAPDGSFGPGTAVASLNTGAADQQPNVSRDGLTVVFASNRDGGSIDVFMATRDSLADDWSTPRNLSDELSFPTAASNETRPSLSWDRTRLYYGADGVVYVSQRRPGPKSD